MASNQRGVVALTLGADQEPVSDRLSEHVFSGSLAIQAILVAVATIVAAAYEKISNLPEVEPTYRKFLWSIAALSAVACLVSFMSFGRLAGVQIPRMLVIGSLLLLIAGTAVVSVGIVVITLYF